MQNVSESVPAGARTEIVFVDTGVAGYEAIVAGVTAGVEVVLINSSADGLSQMLKTLEGREGIDAIHVASHGEAARLLLGSSTLHLGNLGSHADDLAAIGRALAADGDIHLWGCDIGKSQEGRDFVQALAEATGADVAASDDLTGLLGDWELELATGDVAASMAIAWSEEMPTLGTWTAIDLKPNPPGDNYGEGQYYGESLGQSYEQGGFRFSWNGYAEEDSHAIAFGTHWEGQVGVNFVRSPFGDPNTQLTIESVDGSEFWLREFRLSNDATGSTEWTFTGYRDGEIVTPSITIDGLGGGDNYIQIVDPSFANVDKVVVTSADPIRGLNFGIRHGEAVEGTLSAKLAPGDIAVIGVDSVASDAAFVAVRDLPGDHFIFITTAGWNSSTGAWLDADMALLTSGGESLIAWKTPPGGVAAGTVFNLANMPGGVTEGSIYFNAAAEDPYPINDQLLIFDLPDASSIAAPNFVYAINVTDAATATNGFQDTYSAGDEYATWGESGVPDGLVAAGEGGLGSAFGLAPDGSRTALKSGVLQDGMTEEEVLQAIHTSANWESASDWDSSYDFGTRFVSIEMAGPQAPTATNLSQTVAYTEDGGAVALNDIVVTDADDGETITATLTLSNPAAGALSTGTFGSATSTFNAGTGVWTVTGSVADVNAALAAAALTPSANNDQSFTITTRIRDAAGTGPADGTISVTVTGVNDAPTATNLTQTKTATEGGSAVALDDIVVTDVDSGDTVTASLTLSNPTAGALSTGTFGSATSTFNAGTGVWTVTGSVADVNAALAAVAMTPSANNDQNFTIASRIRDAAGTGPADGTISVTVTGVNDAPTATNLTQAKTATEGGSAVALDDIVITDIDSGETVTATLTLSNPAAGMLSTGTFGSATSTFNAGTGVWTVTGSVADVNAALAAAALTPSANNDQNFTIATRIRDAAETGPADGTISVTVTGVNDAPTATNLTQSKAATEGGSEVALDDIVITDIDSGETVTATLTLSDPAAATLSTGTYGSATSTFNAGTGVWTVTGSVADVNAALAAVAMTPSADNDQNFTITTRIRDAAGTGPVDGSISVAVTGVADAPSISAAPTLSTVEDTDLTIAAGDLNFADADGDTLQSVTITGLPGAGALTLDGVAIAEGQVISRADIDAGKLKFAPAADEFGEGYSSFTYTVSDGVLSSSEATATIDVVAVNDAPTLDAAKGYVNTGASTETGGRVVITSAVLNEGDPDDDGTGVTYTITAATSEGTLFVDGNGNNVVDGGEALGASSTFTQADIDLGRIKYQHGGGAGTADGFAFSTADGGEDGAAALTGQTFAISVAERPVLTIGGGTPTHVEDGVATVIAPALTLTDTDSPTMAGATVTITDFAAGDLLGFTNQGGIAGSFDPATGTLTLTGAATTAQYQAALRSVTYSTTSDNPQDGGDDRTIAFTVNDGALTSTAQTAAIDVTNSNDAPTATNLTQTVAYSEDPGGAVALGDIVVSDVDTGDTVTATLALSDAAAGALSTGTYGSVTSTYDAGTGVWTATGSVADVNAALAATAFSPAPNWDQDVTIATRIRDAAGAGPADGTISLDVTAVNDAPTGTVTISGTATQGQTLTAANTIADADGLGTIAYQWQAEGDDIAGATASTLVLTQDHVGKTITVTASYVDDAGNAESLTSAASAAVANVNDAPTGAVTISGAAQVGRTLTASDTLADLDGLGPITYQWQADGVDIVGANGATFALTSDHLGKAISVVASYTDGEGQAESVASSATAAVSNPPPPVDPPSPPSPPTTETIDGVAVETRTGTASDGTPIQIITIPVVTPSREEEVGNNTVADIPLVTDPSGTPLLQAQAPTGFGLQVSGSATPKAAGNSLADLIREIRAHTAAGSADQSQLTGGGSGFLQGLPGDTPLLVQTVTPTVAPGAGAPGEPLVIRGAAPGAGLPQTALVIDARGLPSGAQIQLQNVEFAALIGAVHVSGGAGAQHVWGDGQSQYMVLGEGDDVLYGGGGDDTVGSQAGNDQLHGGEGQDVVFGGDGADFVHGNLGDDTVSGEAGDDLVFGGQGADVVHGNAGNDTVNGDMGQDVVYGGQGEDQLFGGADEDLMFGDLGADILQGNTGADTLDGGAGADTVYGGQDQDVVLGGDDNDLLFGDLGDDYVQGNAGADTLHGGAGNDLLHGGRDDDVLLGGEGDDWLSGDLGDDVLAGGAGADVFMVLAGGGVDRVLDFNAAEGDRVYIDPKTAYTTLQQGGDTVIDLGGGHRMILADVQLASLGDGWILGG
jgi:hypothetical protein